MKNPRKLLGVAAAILGAILASGQPLLAQSSDIWSLSHNASPATTVRLPSQAGIGLRAQYISLADILSGVVPTTDPRLPSFNVKAAPYNAACDGATDDTIAIQAAITAAGGAGGGVVRLPPGTCVFSHLTVTQAKVWLIGEGSSTTNLRSNAATGDAIAFGNTSAGYNGCGGMRDLSIGVSVTKTSGASITVDGCAEGVIDNVRLTTTAGGDGIHISPTGGLAGIWYFHKVTLKLNGAFTGIRVEGSNDQYFSEMWIQGDATSGSVGIDLRNTGGVWFTDVEAVQMGYGVLIDPGNSQSVTWCNFNNVLADHSVLDGWRITQSGSGFVWGNTFNAIWAGTSTNNGVYVGTGIASTFIAPRIWSNGQNGIRIASGASFTAVTGGTIIQNSGSSSGTYDGIAVDASTNNFRITNTTAAGGGFTASQRYGISVAASADNYQIFGNTVSGNVTGPILNTPGLASTRVVTNNPGATMDSYAALTGGLVPVASGGLNLSTATDDNIPVGNGATWQSKALPPCADTTGNHLNYDASTNTFSCGTTGAATAGGWTDSGASVAQTTSTDKVGMGTATTPTEPLSISLNTAQPVASSLSGATMISITPADAGQARMLLRGIGGPAPSIDGVCSGGTLASPSACVSGSAFAQITGSGRDNSAFTSTASVSVQLKASETWSTTGHGAFVDFNVTGTGTTSLVNAARIDASGHLGFPAAVGAPTVSCTGTGTSPPVPTMATGSTDSSFSVIVNTGTSPANTGTCTVTFGKAYATYSFPICMLVDGASAWSNEAVIRLSTKSLSAPVFTWTNEASGVLAALAGSSSYQFTCFVTGI